MVPRDGLNAPGSSCQSIRGSWCFSRQQRRGWDPGPYQTGLCPFGMQRQTSSLGHRGAAGSGKSWMPLFNDHCILISLLMTSER